MLHAELRTMENVHDAILGCATLVHFYAFSAILVHFFF